MVELSEIAERQIFLRTAIVTGAEVMPGPSGGKVNFRPYSVEVKFVGGELDRVTLSGRRVLQRGQESTQPIARTWSVKYGGLEGLPEWVKPLLQPVGASA